MIDDDLTSVMMSVEWKDEMLSLSSIYRDSGMVIGGDLRQDPVAQRGMAALALQHALSSWRYRA